MSNYTFPSDFLWGVAGSAFQMEGAMREGGKCLNSSEAAFYNPETNGRFQDKRPPDVTCDFYHKYPEDLALFKELGVNTFRFSIAWSRIIPAKDAEPCQAGIDYYNRLIDEMLKNGITPFFDLWHSDLPHWVKDNGGLLSDEFPNWYLRYAEVCLREFGDRIKYWSTVNEPSVNVTGAYYRGTAAPFVKDKATGFKAMLIMVLAHFSVCKLYHSMNLGGMIGMVNFSMPAYPNSNSAEDKAAAERYYDWHNKMWLDPLLKGEYPASLMAFPEIADFMPENYNEQLKAAFEPMDFLGINFYTAALVRYDEEADMKFKRLKYESLPIDEYTFRMYPSGMFDLLHRIKDCYGDIPLFIAENGTGLLHLEDLEADAHDPERIDYMREHFRMVHRCIRSGINLKGYFHWTFLDTYEGTMGAYRFRFAMVQVDPKTKKRRPRDSYYYYQTVIANNEVD